MLNPDQQEFLSSLLARSRARIGAKLPNRNRSPQTFTDDQRSGAGPDERDPAKLSRLIDNLILNKGWDLQLATGKLKAQWAEIVGAELGDHVSVGIDFSVSSPRSDGAVFCSWNGESTNTSIVIFTSKQQTSNSVATHEVNEVGCSSESS